MWHRKTKWAKQKKEPKPTPKTQPQKWILEIDDDSDFPAEEGLIWRHLASGNAGTVFCTRKPEERFAEYRIGTDFRAAGREYSAEKDLRAYGQETVWEYDSSGYHDTVGEFTDIYGRRVYCIAERFPCYDRYDRACENRFYRYYFLCEDNKLTRICFADGSEYVSVTEDAAGIDYLHWRKLKAQRWILRDVQMRES